MSVDNSGTVSPVPPLTGRVALVTGASRKAGIGAAIARRLVADGASVLLHGWDAHDEAQPWGADGLRSVAMELATDGGRVATAAADLSDPAAPRTLVESALDQFGRLDILVANHARSVPWGPLRDVTAAEIDLSYAVNTRATLLLVKEFAVVRGDAPDGRVVLLTSGQGQGPMPLEIPYASSKAALAGMTPSLAAALAPNATVNCVNPGPTDTGWASEEIKQKVTAPFGRWGQPDDAAKLIAWLVGPEAGWVTGQVISSDGGWGLTRP
ncbi:SDR family oxidoreductase [Cryptosporangium japonicum]|uniref:SDR family oxidoreductase n=1 Tax=Cryptosporangium japonicum TaxID=80872 RepID=UPI0031CEA674